MRTVIPRGLITADTGVTHVVLVGKDLERGLNDTTSESEDKVEGGLLLDVCGSADVRDDSLPIIGCGAVCERLLHRRPVLPAHPCTMAPAIVSVRPHPPCVPATPTPSPPKSCSRRLYSSAPGPRTMHTASAIARSSLSNSL